MKISKSKFSKINRKTFHRNYETLYQKVYFWVIKLNFVKIVKENVSLMVLDIYKISQKH